MNAAYIESNPIKKIAGLKDSKGNPPPASQIVVCESGKFNKLPRSEFDIEFDKNANTPGLYVMEKMCSGAYLGPVSLIALKAACKDGLFSKSVADGINSLAKLELIDVDKKLDKLSLKLSFVDKFVLPIENSNRNLVKFTKIAKTPDIYPRKYNEIKKKDKKTAILC